MNDKELKKLETELLRRLELEFRRTGIKKVDRKTKRMLWEKAKTLPVFPLLVGYNEGSLMGDMVNHLEIFEDAEDDELVAVPIADYAKMDMVEHYKYLRKSWDEGTDEKDGKNRAIGAYIEYVNERYNEHILKNPEQITTIEK